MSRIARLGLFIFAALVILSFTVFKIGNRRLFFADTYRLHAEFDNVAGLPFGADVRVGGLRKGMVEDIRLPRQPGEKILVVMELESSTRDVVKKDSVASIDTEGLLGNKYLAVSFGSIDAEAVHDGDGIPGRPPLELSDLVKKSNEILDSTKEATSDLQEVASKINRGEGTVGALINDKKIYDRISSVTADAREVTARAKVGVTSFQENMQALKKNWFFRGFFRDRGYQDATELTKHEIAKLPDQPAAKRFIYPGKELFAKPDTAKLQRESSLNQVGSYLEKNVFSMAVVAAYAGTAGEREENQTLTEARAMVVRQYLAKNFKMDDSRVVTKGMGEDDQTDPAKADRVEILVYTGDVSRLARARQQTTAETGSTPGIGPRQPVSTAASHRSARRVASRHSSQGSAKSLGLP